MNKLFSAIAFTTPIIFLILLLILHIIKPEIEPWWRLISEYEIGQYGWLMHLAFIILSLGAISLLLALRPYISGKQGKIGLLLLGTAAFGMLLGGLFVTAPITTPRAEYSAIHIIHNLGGFMMIFSSPFLIGLLSKNLLKDKKWRTLKIPFVILAMLSAVSVACFILLTAVQYRGVADSTMLMGLPNRVLIVAYCLWISVAGWHTLRLSK